MDSGDGPVTGKEWAEAAWKIQGWVRSCFDLMGYCVLCGEEKHTDDCPWPAMRKLLDRSMLWISRLAGSGCMRECPENSSTLSRAIKMLKDCHHLTWQYSACLKRIPHLRNWQRRYILMVRSQTGWTISPLQMKQEIP